MYDPDATVTFCTVMTPVRVEVRRSPGQCDVEVWITLPLTQDGCSLVFISDMIVRRTHNARGWDWAEDRDERRASLAGPLLQQIEAVLDKVYADIITEENASG